MPNLPSECTIATRGGGALRVPAYPAPCTYVRRTDASGAETHHWSEVSDVDAAGTTLAEIFRDGADRRLTAPGFGAEAAVTLVDGGTVRVAAEGPVEYVRVCDAAGRVVVYFDVQEIADDFADAVGALFGAAADEGRRP